MTVIDHITKDFRDHKCVPVTWQLPPTAVMYRETALNFRHLLSIFNVRVSIKRKYSGPAKTEYNASHNADLDCDIAYVAITQWRNRIRDRVSRYRSFSSATLLLFDYLHFLDQCKIS